MNSSARVLTARPDAYFPFFSGFILIVRHQHLKTELSVIISLHLFKVGLSGIFIEIIEFLSDLEEYWQFSDSKDL